MRFCKIILSNTVFIRAFRNLTPEQKGGEESGNEGRYGNDEEGYHDDGQEW
jgi:hypothetical protein